MVNVCLNVGTISIFSVETTLIIQASDDDDNNNNKNISFIPPIQESYIYMIYIQIKQWNTSIKLYKIQPIIIQNYKHIQILPLHTVVNNQKGKEI